MFYFFLMDHLCQVCRFVKWWAFIFCCCCHWASLVAQTVENPPAMWETWVCPWVEKISWRRARQCTPVFLPGESHGQRNLVSYSPWGWRVGHDWVTKHSTAIAIVLRKRQLCEAQVWIFLLKLSFCALCTKSFSVVFWCVRPSMESLALWKWRKPSEYWHGTIELQAYSSCNAECLRS